MVGDLLGQGPTKIKSIYGFARPYDFSRAFPFLTATLLLIFIVGIGGLLFATDSLSWGTYRLIYFAYIGAIALAAATLSFAPRFAWLLIALCTVECTLGIGTSILVNIHVLPHSRLPLNDQLSDEAEFQYHPLLMGVPTPNLFRFSPFKIRHDSYGVPGAEREKIQHDSYGLRGAERDKNKLRHQIIIATVGGSTTYDLGVSNGQTWSDDLERQLGDKYAVLNHGVPGYSTVENLIQTLFYLNSYDIRPKCAIYYEGWNDIRNAHVPNLDPGHARYALLKQVTALKLQKTPLLAKISPLSEIVLRYLQAWLEIIPLAKDFSSQDPVQGSDPRLENFYRANIKAIAAINESRGITSIFVGQVLNRAKLRKTTRYGFVPLVRDIDVWPLQARFNTILETTATKLGVPFLIPPIDNFEDSDFVDQGHFSAKGAEKFAAMLAPIVRADCN